MRKILLSTLLALMMLVSLAIPVAADTGLGISPVSLDITLDEGESGVWEFYAYYFSGNISIEAIDIPISVSPNSFDISSSPSMLPITLTNIAPTAGVYTGYLRFTGLSANNTGLAIQIDVNILVTATVDAPASSGGGGGGSGGGKSSLSTTPTQKPEPEPVIVLPELGPEPLPQPVPAPSPLPSPDPEPVETVVFVPEPDTLATVQAVVVPVPDDKLSIWDWLIVSIIVVVILGLLGILGGYIWKRKRRTRGE